MAYGLHGFSVHGISQARTVEWVAMPSWEGDLPNSEIEPMSPVLVGGFFTTDPPGKSLKVDTNSFNSFLHVVYSSSYGITCFFWYLVI